MALPTPPNRPVDPEAFYVCETGLLYFKDLRQPLPAISGELKFVNIGRNPDRAMIVLTFD